MTGDNLELCNLVKLETLFFDQLNDTTIKIIVIKIPNNQKNDFLKFPIYLTRFLTNTIRQFNKRRIDQNIYY